MQGVGITTKGWAIWEGDQVWYYPLIEGVWYVYDDFDDEDEDCATSADSLHDYLNVKSNISVPLVLILNETLNN